MTRTGVDVMCVSGRRGQGERGEREEERRLKLMQKRVWTYCIQNLD